MNGTNKLEVGNVYKDVHFNHEVIVVEKISGSMKCLGYFKVEVVGQPQTYTFANHVPLQWEFVRKETK